MIQFFHVYKSFGDQFALQDVSVQIQKGEFVYLTGPSGAGKTTFLNLIFAAQRPNRGQILFNGQNITRLSPRSIPFLRRNIGVVFQDFKLLPRSSVEQNVSLPLEVLGTRRAVARRRTFKLLKEIGLGHKLHQFPLRLSGGEQQRVAIARAFASKPSILFADEPTGNLDTANGEKIIELLFDLNAEFGTTIVLVTHESRLAERCSRTIKLTAGRVDL